MSRLLLTATFFLLNTVQSAHKDRGDQIDRIKQYTISRLTPINVDDDTITMEFDAFDQHYSVEFKRQTHVTPSNVMHSNVDHNDHRPWSLSDESCHFHGRVLNTNSSIVSASFCKGRGIRARISAFNEILIIKPSAYYLDLRKDAMANHSLDDEVLIYRLSDFERPDIMGTEGISDYALTDELTMDDIKFGDESDDRGDRGARRRLYSSSKPAQTEVTVLIGPVRTANFKQDYGGNWYRVLYQDTADMMNEVDAIYKATNWNKYSSSSIGNAGSVRIRFSEIHVVYAFTGDYAVMKPKKRFSNCKLSSSQFDDSNACAIYGNSWLGGLSKWINSKMSTNHYDNVLMMSDIKFNYKTCSSSNGGTYICSRTLGWGNIGVICKGSSSVSAVSVVEGFGGPSGAVGTVAHEIGHNFGLYHDGQSGPAKSCGANSGLMGYGNNHDTFSSCSLSSMKTYFTGKGNGLKCLSTGWDGKVVSNVGSSVTVPTPNPVIPSRPPTPPTPAPTYSTSGGCIYVKVGYDALDGTWDAIDGGYSGKAAYRIENVAGSPRYLYYKKLTLDGKSLKWVMSSKLGSNSIYFFCTKDSLLSCGGKWKQMTGSTSYTSVTNSVTNTKCVANVDNSCNSYSCIYMTGSGTEYDGYYSAGSSCNDGQRVFEGTSGRKLCYSESRERWLFSKSVCSIDKVISAKTSGDPLSPNYWMKNSGGTNYKYSDDIYISDCGANAAFTGLECLDSNEYGQEICLSTTNTDELWGGAATFTLYEELCTNDQPVFRLEIYNDTDIIDFGGAVIDGFVEETFYVHYQPQYLLTTDNETTGQWMVSRDEISIDYVALCQQEDLMECTASHWEVKVTEYADDGPLNGSVHDGIIENLLDQHMTVAPGQCGSDLNEDDERRNIHNVAMILMTVLSVAIVCLAALCFWRRWKLQKSVRSSKSTDEGQYALMATEPELEVEVPVQNGNHIAV